MASMYPADCEGWGGSGILPRIELARLVLAHFPAGELPSGENVQEVAYAVAAAESGRDPKA